MAKLINVQKRVTTYTVELTEAEIVGITKTIGATSPAQRVENFGCTKEESLGASNVYNTFYSKLDKALLEMRRH